ncbi:hypothetical protein H2248_000568 [Termitomyces sp. 'cryptogamus']|nr:hypothetical protein H2248_000568 [Termitomyces sp. 'cryptogamus']
MGNGAKAQQKRERNADKNAAKGSKSQSKVNEAAKSIVCSDCRQSFLITTRAPASVYYLTCNGNLLINNFTASPSMLKTVTTRPWSSASPVLLSEPMPTLDWQVPDFI